MTPDEVRNSSELTSCRVLALLNGTKLYGQEKANIQALMALRSHGAKVLFGVSTLENGGEVKAYIEQLGFSTVSFPFGRQWSKQVFRADPSLIAKNLASIWRCSNLAWRQVREFRATHVHIGSQLVYSFIAPYLTLDRKTQLIFRMGDDLPLTSRPNLLIWKSCFKRANVVVANSAFVRNSILRNRPLGKNKTRLIYNRALLDMSAEKVLVGHPGDYHEAKDETGTLLLYVGQLSPHKGIEDLIEATINLMEDWPALRLDVVGDSPYSPTYQQGLENRVQESGFAARIRFHGYRKDPAPFYDRADILVVPSRCEEAGANVVLEAKRMGVPSVVYPSGGLPELIIHRENGIVCRDKSVLALIEGLQWYLKSPQIIAQHGRAAIDDDGRRFGYDRFWRQWRDIYLGRETLEDSFAIQ